MGLEIARGDRIEIVASGPDAARQCGCCRNWCSTALARRHARQPATAAAAVGVAAPERSDDPNVLVGVAASPGIAVGNVFQVRHEPASRGRGRQRRPTLERQALDDGARAGDGGAGCASGEAPTGGRRRKGRYLRRSPRTARRSGSAGDCGRSAVARQERGIRLAGCIHPPRGPVGEPEERASRRARERPARRRAARPAEADRRRGRAGHLRGRHDPGG